MRAVVAVAVFALSAVAAADPPRRIPPPEHLVARPLEVGQWVTYREHIGTRDAGTVSLVVVNRAACGLQFLAVLAASGVERRWVFCVDDEHRLVKATLDGKLVVLQEHLDELGPLLTRVLPPQLVGAFVREDLDVPAGHFEGTLRADGKTMTWLHPDVPLGGVVQVRAGQRVDELVGYGSGNALEPVDKPKRPTHFVVQFFELALGTAYRTHTPMSDHLTGVSVSLGRRATERVDTVLWATARDNRAQVSSDADQTATGYFLLGARWHPFGRRGAAIGLPYVELAGGYALVTAGEARGDGVAAGARIGWELTDTGTWAAGFQGEYILDHTFGDVSGTHQLFDGTFAVRLQLP